MLNIALFGPPGAGKGTQSKKLLEKYNLTYISTGDMLRSEIAEGSELGMKAKSIIEKGGLVDDELIIQLIEKKINTNPDSRGILFDGFPRTTVQAYILEGLLLRLNSSLNCMISLEVPEKELVTRLLLRAKESGRSDDSMEVIKVRLREYEEKTKPVADFYAKKNKYYALNGVGNIDNIFENIDSVIEKTKTKTQTNMVLLGKPGAGKGTQGNMLAEELGLVYISTGKMMRQEIKDGTEIGKLAKPYMDKGEIVPDEIPIQLIERMINENPHANGFIFKGFPRTLIQAYILDGLLQRVNMSVSALVEMKITTLEAIKRLSERAKTPKARSYDHSTELIINRLEQYRDKTLPVIDFYKNQGKYYAIKADGDESEVFLRLKAKTIDVFKENY
ncbi:MAG: adenylate kinase [Bacteroidales bacterium]|nr:adenylate kinase [Bacteroidales bacterium]